MTPEYITALSNCMPTHYSLTSAYISENSFAVVEICGPNGMRYDIRLDARGITGHAKRVPKGHVRALAQAMSRLLDTDSKPC